MRLLRTVDDTTRHNTKGQKTADHDVEMPASQKHKQEDRHIILCEWCGSNISRTIGELGMRVRIEKSHVRYGNSLIISYLLCVCTVLYRRSKTQTHRVSHTLYRTLSESSILYTSHPVFCLSCSLTRIDSTHSTFHTQH